MLQHSKLFSSDILHQLAPCDTKLIAQGTRRGMCRKLISRPSELKKMCKFLLVCCKEQIWWNSPSSAHQISLHQLAPSYIKPIAQRTILECAGNWCLGLLHWATQADFHSFLKRLPVFRNCSRCMKENIQAAGKLYRKDDLKTQMSGEACRLNVPWQIHLWSLVAKINIGYLFTRCYVM